MRRLVLFFLMATLLTVPAQAAGGYSFDIRVTDGRTAILASPDYPAMDVTAETVERAAGDRVVVLDKTEGARWRWLMLSWFDNDPSVVQQINDRGGAREKADFGLAAGRLGNFRLRCLRDECGITVKAKDERESAFTVKRGDWSPDLPLGSRVSLTFR